MEFNTNDLYDFESDLLKKDETIMLLENDKRDMRSKIESLTSLLNQAQNALTISNEKEYIKENKTMKQVVNNDKKKLFYNQYKNDEEVRKQARSLMIADKDFVHWKYVMMVTEQKRKEQIHS
jgi:hypothetical protein